MTCIREGISHDFDYLLGMPLWSLTKEKKEELQRKEHEKEMELRTVRETTGDVWGC